MTLLVLEPGIATTVQDLGRPGLAHLGVPPSGAVDPALVVMLNRLVGNRPDAAVLETVGGLRVRAGVAVLVAHDAASAPHRVAAGAEITIAAGGARRWHYLAVQGGIVTPTVLGSRSHDTLSGLAQADLTAGVELPLGPSSPYASPVDVAPIPFPAATVRVRPGPRADWFDDPVAALTTNPWKTAEVSRVGVRLRGPAIARRLDSELASEGLVRGAIQVPPDGQPVMMLADHPTTGGYPVIAVVDADDVAHVAQCAADALVRFRS